MDNLIEVTVPNPGTASEDRARQALAQAESRLIASHEDYQAAAEDLKSIKGKWNEIDAARKTLKKPIDEAAKAIQSFFSGPLDFLMRAESILKGKMVVFSNEQERLRIEHQRQADEIARKERERIEALRREAEAKARAEQDRLRKEADAAAAAGRAAEAAKLAAKAVSVQEKFDARDAQLEERSAAVVAPVIQREAPKVSGISSRAVWKYAITDPSKLPREYTQPDDKKISSVVRALKGDTKIEGVKVWEDTGIAAGSR